MSEPVIPERYKLQHSGFVGMLANGSEDGNGFVELLVLKLMGELAAAEAKVAEQEATITKEESRSNELAKEVAILRVDLKGQAATIERLAKERDFADALLKGKTVTVREVKSALNKQEPK